MANLILSRLVHSALGAGLMNVLEQSIDHRPNVFRILTYHRVLDAYNFEQQMAYLDVNYHIVSMPDLLQACQEGRELRPETLLITFDDAYSDVEECAWPIMKKYDLPATVFVPTAFPDNPNLIFWWDRLQHAFEYSPRRDALDTPAGKVSLGTTKERDQAYRKVRDRLKEFPYTELLSWTHRICNELDAPPAPHRVLGWEALRRLAEDGVTLGAHTRRHRFLDQLSPAEVEDEVRGSLQDIERETGSALPILAYPNGRFNDAVVNVVKRAGVTLAFATARGANRLETADPLRLRRINIGPRATVADLRARLLQAVLPLTGGVH